MKEHEEDDKSTDQKDGVEKVLKEELVRASNTAALCSMSGRAVRAINDEERDRNLRLFPT